MDADYGWVLWRGVGFGLQARGNWAKGKMILRRLVFGYPI